MTQEHIHAWKYLQERGNPYRDRTTSSTSSEIERVSMAQEPKPGVTAERRIIGDTRKLVLYLNSLDSDVYQVEVEGKGIGKIGVTLDIGHYTGDAYSSRNQAIINCSECPELQGSKQREERQVQLNDKGYGTEQLGPNRYLVVDLGRRAVPRPVYGTHGWERPQAGKEVWDR